MSFVVLDPTSELVVSRRERSPRLDRLEGRTVGLLDISKGRGDIFLDRVHELLNREGVRVLRFAKPTFSKPAPIDLRHQIATQCHAAIEALAD